MNCINGARDVEDPRKQFVESLRLYIRVADDLAPFRRLEANALGERLRELTIEKMKLGARNFSRKLGSPKMRCVCALSLTTMSCGVPLGAANPYHDPAS